MAVSKAQKFLTQLEKLIEIYSEHEYNFLRNYSSHISQTEMRVISFIGKRKKCIMSEISKSLLIPKNNLTAVMDKLVEKKYVYRRRSEKDRRIVNIALTSEGKSLYRDENSIQVQLSGKLLKSLEKTDKDMLIALMKKLNGE